MSASHGNHPPGRRDGWRTTEFVVSVLTCGLCALGLFLTDAHSVALGGAVVSAVGYQVSRSWVKAARIRVDR